MQGTAKHRLSRLHNILTALVLMLGTGAAVVTLAASPAWAANCGDVLATVNDVDVKSNGANQSTGTSCGGSGMNTAQTPSGATVSTGYMWQCVEFVNRYYVQKGWITARWAGNGSTLKDKLPSGLTFMADGSITSIVVGDVVTLSYSTFGHAGVVSAVNGNTITIANQNASGVYGTATYDPVAKTLTSEYSSYTTQGVIHAAANTGSSSGGGTAADRIDELGFVRTNHSSGQSELVAWHGAPNYTTLRAYTLTGYPAISDPQWVKPIAIDVNGDGIDELGFVRFNHSSGRTELSLWHGAPNYTTLLITTLTGYPAITDPQNVTPLALDTNGDGIDELGFVRTNHSSGRSEIVVYHGSPNYTTLLVVSLTGYPSVTDPQNVTPIAIDANGDRRDELGFVRTNHGSGNTELVMYHGSPNYTTLYASTLTGYPSISDPLNVTPLALHLPN